ncbi:hypothetical protein WJX81_005508 [Elliptochloris bilobata]|uniref:Anaphase-promoting complex subunit 4 WD40 domain-containing protein n=1 Tax=Elliptochloris bilobata TaxID=381761 RepID=A0AAW1QU44_9CHLO
MKLLFALSKGLGSGGVVFAWSALGEQLAAAGQPRAVLVHARDGSLLDRIELPTPGFSYGDRLPCARQLQWDPGSTRLAILPRGQAFALVYDVATRALTRVPTGRSGDEAARLAWAHEGALLALCSARGGLVLYNAADGSCVDVLNRHSRGMSCAVWGSGGRLALGGRDQQVTVSEAGAPDVYRGWGVRGDPREVALREGEAGVAAAVSVNVGGRSICVFSLDDGAEGEPGAVPLPLELRFDDSRGQVARHAWLSGGLLLVGFSIGMVAVLIAAGTKAGEELHAQKCLEAGMADMVLSADRSCAALVGGPDVRFLRLDGAHRGGAHEAPGMALTLKGCSVGSAAWSPDGHLFALATQDGQLRLYPPAWGGDSGGSAGGTGGGVSARVDLPVEPTLLALGPRHLAAAAGRQVWICDLPVAGRAAHAPLQLRHAAQVEAVALNAEHATVLCQGQGVRRVWPQPAGVRALFEDNAGDTYLFSALDGSMLRLPSVMGLAAALWDLEDCNCAILVSGGSPAAAAAVAAHTVVYTPVGLDGPSVRLVSTQSLPEGHRPLLLQGGVLACLTGTGSLASVLLDTHAPLKDSVETGAREEARLRQRLAAALALGKSGAALAAAKLLAGPAAWRQAGAAAVRVLDAATAARCYREAGDAALASALEGLSTCEDRSLLAGHLVELTTSDTDTAQALFLASSQPAAAVALRARLGQWPQALALAQRHDPAAIAPLLCQHGRALEQAGDHAAARDAFERALALGADPNPIIDPSHAGLPPATAAPDSGRLEAAADLCLAAKEDARAMELLVRAGALTKAAPLVQAAGSAPLHAAFAQACEGAGRLSEAAAAYEAAGDALAAVRATLAADPGQGSAAAAALALRMGSPAAAAAVVQHCQGSGTHAAAVEMLLLAGQPDAAFAAAAAHGVMAAFARALGTSGTHADCERAAAALEAAGEFMEAGSVRERRGQIVEAVALYIKAGGEALARAINIAAAAAAAGDASPADLLATHLEAAVAAEPRAHAAVTVIFGLEHADIFGSFRTCCRSQAARAGLLSAWQAAVAAGKPVPEAVAGALALVHSYLLAPRLERMGDHEGAARLLARCARRAGADFPAHAADLTADAVVACTRAGMRASAFELAATALRGPLADSLAPMQRRRLEAVVRRRDCEGEAEEARCACVHRQAHAD